MEQFEGLALFDIYPRALPNPKKSDVLNGIVLCVMEGRITMQQASRGIAFLLMDRRKFFKKYKA
jgi:hypothetical protein